MDDIIEKYDKGGKLHVLDKSQIDDYDDVDEDQQQTFIYCKTDKKYEWHWLPRRKKYR